MKKIIFSLAIFTGALVSAQSCCKGEMKGNQDMKEMHQKKHTEHMDNMKKELGLSDAQVTKINALHQERMAKMEAVQKERMEAMKKEREKMEAEMGKILSPEQFTKWKDMMKERMEMGKGKMMRHHGCDMPEMKSDAATTQTTQS